MEKTFKRKPLSLIISIIAIIFFGGMMIYQYTEGLEIASPSIYITVILILIVIWEIFNPFLRITEEQIIFKLGIFNSRTFDKNAIHLIEFPNEKQVMIHLKNGNIYKISLYPLNKKSRKELKEELSKIHD
ncbi:hypothetical protein [Aureivirga sp. CE67]|uniref:hypothetical protein n=1 Tax=Aureivirga sp. CE67 TaxID=1788983 RepID=UPI0018CAB150|nr:hypothetical protein [Aureivirga sp. CE67]